MGYNRETGWTRQGALTVGAILRATSATEAEFDGGGVCLCTADQTVSPTGVVYDVAGQLPVGALILGVTARVLTDLTGCAAWSLGTAALPEAWGAWLSVGAGTLVTSGQFTASDLIATGAAARPVRLTARDGTFTGGSVLLRTAYFVLEAP